MRPSPLDPLRQAKSGRLGRRRRFAPLRQPGWSEAIPSIAAVLALAVALVNIVSALTPHVPWRIRVVTSFEPLAALPVIHAVALPAGACLAVIATNLARRRRRALHAAVLVLLVVGGLDLLRGLNVGEATLSWGLAGLLWWGRDAFVVRARPLAASTLPWPITLLIAAAATLAGSAVVADLPPGSGALVVLRETAALLVWTQGPTQLQTASGLLHVCMGLLGLVIFLGAAWIAFRPLASARLVTDERARHAARDLVRVHGRDTLSFFKLRRDAHHFFSNDGKAFLAYRIENGVLLISGDPVGPAPALPSLLRDLCAFAELRGLKLGAVGVSRALVPLYERTGMRAFYIGDEAIVDTQSFSLEGRAIRKVRQSVTRLEGSGYTTAIERGDELDPTTFSELERISCLWRAGAPERGFAMTMDSLGGEHRADTLFVVARDANGRVRGFLSFVPTYARAAMSLSHMRRDRNTPNGLTEFLIVRSIELMRERRIDEVSLNFAAFARWIRSPDGWRERALRRLVSLIDPFFQITSLYRFNTKFEPRWEPRYLLYEGPLSFPRVGLAVLRAEGHFPRFRASQ